MNLKILLDAIRSAREKIDPTDPLVGRLDDVIGVLSADDIAGSSHIVVCLTTGEASALQRSSRMLVDEAGERPIVVVRGTDGTMSTEVLRSAERKIRRARGKWRDRTGIVR